MRQNPEKRLGENDDRQMVGSHSYRDRGSATTISVLAILLAVGGILLLRLVDSIKDNFLGVIATAVVLTILSAIFAACLWAWTTNRKDRLEISPQGLTYGREFWRWETIVACELTTLPAFNRWCIRIWTKKGEMGPGRVLLIDQEISDVRKQRLTSAINQFIRQSRR
jgi:hypothetical protein